MSDFISIKGAKVHNLKNIDIEIPKGKLTVVTGVSGSGKSSLVYDIIYKEAHRRYLENASFLNKFFAPKYQPVELDSISGLSPVIAISQKQGIRNSSSTVGSVTQLSNRLKVLFSLLGQVECPYCQNKIATLDTEQLSEKICNLPNNSRLELFSPIFKSQEMDFNELISNLRNKGCKQLTINGVVHGVDNNLDISWNDEDEVMMLAAVIVTDKNKKDYNFEINRAFLLGGGLICIKSDDLQISTCSHNLVMEKLQPGFLSDCCQTCKGQGEILTTDVVLTVKDYNKPILKGAFHKNAFMDAPVSDLMKKFNIAEDMPLKDIPAEFKEILFYGYSYDDLKVNTSGSGYEYVIKENQREYVHVGIKKFIEKSYKKAIENLHGHHFAAILAQFMLADTCPDCLGSRLNKQVSLVKVEGYDIFEVGEFDFSILRKFLNRIRKKENLNRAVDLLLGRMLSQLKIIDDIGLSYLNLNRRSNSLSGGELQRLRISGHVGSGIARVIYIFDEPSIGLHSKDTGRLINILYKLRDQGNTVIVVEHDPEIIMAADHIVELGPAAGIHGGNLLVSDTLSEALKNSSFLTGHYLNGHQKVESKITKKRELSQFLTIKGASSHNLKNITVKIPLNCLCVVTGVSGSGKSTLINDILAKALLKHFYKSKIKVGKHEAIVGVELIKDIRLIDQSPIGKSSRSNPATYTKIFDKLRKIFASQPEAVELGYTENHFSFNNKDGWCSECEGRGILDDDNDFLLEDERICPVCLGTRFRSEILQITYQDKNIAEILNLTLEEAAPIFKDDRLITARLKVLNELGLGYITLGQSSATLSGGECQRLKLASELGKLKKQEHALYILDEPTTGLHLDDIQKLVKTINRLVDAGNTVVVIEHNLDFIACADYILDLGPEGGENGGLLIAEGSVEEVSKDSKSATGICLRSELK